MAPKKKRAGGVSPAVEPWEELRDALASIPKYVDDTVQNVLSNVCLGDRGSALFPFPFDNRFRNFPILTTDAFLEEMATVDKKFGAFLAPPIGDGLDLPVPAPVRGRDAARRRIRELRGQLGSANNSFQSFDFQEALNALKHLKKAIREDPAIQGSLRSTGPTTSPTRLQALKDFTSILAELQKMIDFLEYLLK